MNYKNIFIVVICLFLFVISCNKNNKNINPRSNLINNFSIAKYKTISFTLDSLTSDVSISSQYIEEEDMYTFLSNKNEILFYDSNGNLHNKIPIINGVSSYLISEDTIFLFNYLKNSLIVLKSSSKNQQEILIEKKISYYPAPASGISKLIKNNDDLLFFGNISGEYKDENKSNRLICGKINLKSQNVSYYLSYPDLYYENNWGGGMYRWIYSTYNQFNNDLIISFPAHHHIYRTNLKFEVYDEHYAGSHRINKIPR